MGERVEKMMSSLMSEIPKNLSYIAPVFRVADISRSLAFYRDQLGFAVDFVHEGLYAGLSRDGCHIHLKHSPPAPRDQTAFEQEEHIDACVIVQNAERLSASFAAAGVSFVVALRHMPYGTEFYIRDPDGYVLGFIQPTPTFQ
jgi:catechol 2,3-dioxygenase-like lactoylglutathione lyase family enzyme